MDTPNCIRQTHADHLKESWCGRKLIMEFFFENIDHAVYYLQKNPDNKKAVCKKCLDTINQIIND